MPRARAGEPGASVISLAHVDALVERLLEQVLSDAPGHRYLALQPAEHVCLLVNNLGATTLMELAVAARHAIALLESRWRVCVVRAFTGTFMSSLDMAGISLSVMKLDDLRAARLDALTRAPSWPSLPGVRTARRPLVVPVSPASLGSSRARGRPTDAALLEASVRRACARIQACQPQLNHWDRLVGDGDCGDTLGAGAGAVLAALDSLADRGPLGDAATALRLVGSATERMGGSSGALYHIGLTAAAAEAAARASMAEPEAAMWAAALAAAVQAVMECGGARPGCRCARRARRWRESQAATLAACAPPRARRLTRSHRMLADCRPAALRAGRCSTPSHPPARR